MEKGYGTDISTHEDTRASARTMEAPGSAFVGDGIAEAVGWGEGGREGGGVYVWSRAALGKVGLGADDR